MTTDRQRMANKHENEIAEEYGGEVTPMSGAGWVSKQDVRTGHELIEAKATAAESYSLKLDLLVRLDTQAILAAKRPVLDIKLKAGLGRGRRYVVLSKDDYLALTRKAGER